MNRLQRDVLSFALYPMVLTVVFMASVPFSWEHLSALAVAILCVVGSAVASRGG